MALVLFCGPLGIAALRTSVPSVTDYDRPLVGRGAALFSTTFTPAQGLGPLFNRASCIGCHAGPSIGGMGPGGLGTATRVGRLSAAGFEPMTGRGGPIARAHSVAEQGLACDLEAGIPAGANVTSVRNAPDLHGSGLIDALSDDAIAAGAIPRGSGVQGHPNWILTSEGRRRIGRFGWKASTVSLGEFVANAFRNELGMTNPSAPVDLTPLHHGSGPACPGEGSRIEVDGSVVGAVTAFVATLLPRSPRTRSRWGAALFHGIGCDACHTPNLGTATRRVQMYSDLLLHDMGPDLDDKMVEGQAGGRDWRTTPLWGLGTRMRLLHDGRARNIIEAILAHGGEGEQARARFKLLSARDRGALLVFLGGL